MQRVRGEYRVDRERRKRPVDVQLETPVATTAAAFASTSAYRILNTAPALTIISASHTGNGVAAPEQLEITATAKGEYYSYLKPIPGRATRSEESNRSSEPMNAMDDSGKIAPRRTRPLIRSWV